MSDDSVDNEKRKDATEERPLENVCLLQLSLATSSTERYAATYSTVPPWDFIIAAIIYKTSIVVHELSLL